MSTEPDTEQITTPEPDTAGAGAAAHAAAHDGAAHDGAFAPSVEAGPTGMDAPTSDASAGDARRPSTPEEPVVDVLSEPTRPVVEPAPSHRIDWERHATAAGRWLIRPRVRLTLIGVALVLIGALWVSDSLWQLVLVVVGLITVLVAWAGSKLEGHLRIDWGESGTEFEFRTKVHSQAHSLKLSAPSYDPPNAQARSVATTEIATRAEPTPSALAGADQLPGAGHAATAAPRVDLALVPADPDVIEGTGRTVEIDLDQLKGLIAAAEAEDAARAARRAG